MIEEIEYSPPPLIFKKGFMVDLHYENIEQMERDDDNWKHYCNYQLLPGALKGRHRILQLESMQIAFAHRPFGGAMVQAGVASGCITFSVIESSEGKISFDRLKLEPGDIVFFDDSQNYRFVSSGAFNLSAVNIRKERIEHLMPLISKALMHTIYDDDGMMTKILHDIWDRFAYPAESEMTTDDFSNAEDEVIAILNKLLGKQVPQVSHLTEGEKTALAVRDKVIQHMDGKFTVEMLSKEFGISKRTLQNSFKSLFGFTPSLFLRNLKLNHVHHELKEGSSQLQSVSRVAQKWGFSHMGRFSKYYKELFGESPSLTLRKSPFEDNGLPDVCVLRKEEMD